MNTNLRWPFRACVVAGIVLIALALHFGGAAEIRSDFSEVWFLTGIGCLGLLVAFNLFPWLGLSYWEDVIARKNAAALITLCGAILAVALLYAGSSLGEGSSYWDNFFSVGLGTACWLLLWIILELGTKISISITEDRDLASGLRMGAYLLATGLVLGRAVAGNWESVSATLRDLLLDGWPAAALCLIALALERYVRPNRQRPFPSWAAFGLLPALLYLALAGAWVWHLGPWEGMPQ